MENDVNKIIGKNLLTLRKLNKLTQLELAEKLSYSDKSISKWEKGESLPSIEILYELAKFYHVTLDALTTDGADFSSPTQQVKSRREKFFPTRLCVTLLAVVAIWLIATVMFVSFKLALDKNFFMCFIWAIPASKMAVCYFNRFDMVVYNRAIFAAYYIQHLANLLFGYSTSSRSCVCPCIDQAKK